MDIQVGVTQKDNPRLEPCHEGRASTPAILLLTKGHEQANGKWGWSGKADSAVKGSEKGGSRILWSTWISSGGGGQHATADLLWVTRVGSIGLTNGKAVTFDGREVIEVAGGALDAGNDPTRS